MDITVATKLDIVHEGVTHHGNYQGVKSDEAVIKYVTKGGVFIASKDRDELLAKHECRVGKKKIIGKELLGIPNVRALAEHVRDKRPELLMDYDRVRKGYISHKLDIEPAIKVAGTRGIWISGAPGIGKTHCILDKYGDSVYEKSQNKWWDGYCNERIVLLDDLDTMGGNTLGHYIKRWADKWQCKAEQKGSTV